MFVRECWLAKIICQSEGGDRSIILSGGSAESPPFNDQRCKATITVIKAAIFYETVEQEAT